MADEKIQVTIVNASSRNDKPWYGLYINDTIHMQGSDQVTLIDMLMSYLNVEMHYRDVDPFKWQKNVMKVLPRKLSEVKLSNDE
jgi:hypothetical protein